MTSAKERKILLLIDQAMADVNDGAKKMYDFARKSHRILKYREEGGFTDKIKERFDALESKSAIYAYTMRDLADIYERCRKKR